MISRSLNLKRHNERLEPAAEKPMVAEVIVCDPRRNKLMGDGNKADKIDTNKLAELLRGGHLKAVYHGSQAIRTLKELVHNYDALVDDSTRVMNRRLMKRRRNSKNFNRQRATDTVSGSWC